jgi:hypothetical protein
LNLFHPDPDQLLLVRRDVNRARGRGVLDLAVASGLLAFIDRLQLHAAIRGDTRLIGLVGRVHGVMIVEDLPAAASRAVRGSVIVPAHKKRSDNDPE